MRSRLAKLSALIVAALLAAMSLMAQQHPAGEQPILFSSPDGETVSNALLPSAEAPQPDVWSDLPSEVPDNIAMPQTPGPRLPRPAKRPNSLNKNGDENNPDMMTPSEIMGVPTLEQIFGLSGPYATYDQKKSLVQNLYGLPGMNANGVTNKDSQDESAWTKILTGDTNGNMFASDKVKNPNTPGDFFDTASSDGLFGRAEKSQDDSVFGPSVFGQTTVEQSGLNSSAQQADSSLPDYGGAFSQGNSAFGSGFNSGMSVPATPAPVKTGFDSLPQLPSLPSLPGQNINSFAAPPPPPSWEPKPPPWLSSTPQLGTMPQRKF
jgi:hypothetical protein